MLAGQIILSAMIGFLVTASAFVLAVPTGMALLLYPAVCSLSLLTLAMLGSLRSGSGQGSASILHQEA